ncbi:helix-turn-helix domain-containing protein [Roseovarius sp.]|uniref:GlxA family transcriptional regulator n=1 Tax=Roseovarius sp. TaxID=1486281 RepID=UPI00261EEA8F|nr:helix-turn-helix domain-containing protein [Roseovarius sp.]MDM8167605.1 helix-turn-helix domain-containing protein [Roseovarius sp.]
MPEWTKFPDRPVRIAFLLFDEFSNLCLANCIEPLRAANTLTHVHAFDWRIVTMDGRTGRSSSGIDILASAALSQVGAVDYLFVLASYAHESHDTSANRRMLRTAARRAEVTVGLDSGPWLLASAGLLSGRRATVHWDLLDAFTERFLDVEASQARVLKDGPYMTCAGAMSALDLTLDLIAEHLGLSARLDVEALFLHGDPPVGKADEAVADPLVRRALAVMRETVERPLPLKQLAKRVSCQPRTLDRHFRARLGAPPGTVYRQLRLSAARKLIEDSRRSISEIALRCGYESPAALTRAIRRAYGATPSALRRK